MLLLPAVIDCGGLEDPENGQVIISPGLVTTTGVGAVAAYTCNTSAGFMLVGPPVRNCQDSGQWSGMVPECTILENDMRTSIQLGPVVGGAAAGFVVVVLVTMAIIFGTVYVLKRKHLTNDFQLNTFKRRSNQAALTHFQSTEIDIETSRNEAYITSAETFPNEAYTTSDEMIPNEAYITNVATSLNKAYGAFPSTDNNGADEYNYINPQTFSSGESNDEPSIELYDYVRGEFPQTHT